MTTGRWGRIPARIHEAKVVLERGGKVVLERGGKVVLERGGADPEVCPEAPSARSARRGTERGW